MKQQQYRPILITDARPSRDEELHSRQVRYLTMMSVRAVCLIVGAVLVSAQAPLLWLWIPVCVVGTVLVPWLAVIIANDGPVRQEHRFANVLRRRRQARGLSHGAVPAPERPYRVGLPAGSRESRTVDADIVRTLGG